MKDQNVLQAKRKDLLKHDALFVQSPCLIQMKDKKYFQDFDSLSVYGQDDPHRLAVIAKEMLVKLEYQNPFLH